MLQETVIISLEKYEHFRREIVRLYKIEEDIQKATEQYLINFEKGLYEQMKRDFEKEANMSKDVYKFNEELIQSNSHLNDKLNAIPNWIKRIFH